MNNLTLRVCLCVLFRNIYKQDGFLWIQTRTFGSGGKHLIITSGLNTRPMAKLASHLDMRCRGFDRPTLFWSLVANETILIQLVIIVSWIAIIFGIGLCRAHSQIEHPWMQCPVSFEPCQAREITTHQYRNVYAAVPFLMGRSGTELEICRISS